ncbi:MAG: serine/threonine-protein kinase, partial [Cyanobacteria bacterium P01_A01_bin.135]
MALNFFQSFKAGSGKALGGRYTLLKPLGEGGFGHTFLAKDLHLPGHPQCVIKQLKPSDRRPSQLQVARRLFDTEAQALYHLGTHPQIPRLLAHFEDNGEFYLAQDFIDGHSMAEEFEATPWNEAKLVTFLGDVLGILAFVHQQQVIHRDLKPANLIRRRRDNRLVMIDFGAVKQVRTQLAVDQPNAPRTVVIGTQGYMPSEQLVGQPRFSSDVYAVGVMGVQALTGQPPETLLRSPNTGELDWHRHTQASFELVTLIDKLVRYDFRTRYRDAQAALAALKALPPHLSQHIPSKPAKKSDLPNAWSPNDIPDAPIPPAAETQQTVAVVGRSPADAATHTPAGSLDPLPAPPI